MVLLDGEEVSRINISPSNGVGDVNPEIMLSFSDQASIQVFKKAITSAVGSDREINGDPDFDIEVVYQEGLPTHAIHLWLGGKDEESMMTYMVDTENTTYLTTSKLTNQLRSILDAK